MKAPPAPVAQQEIPRPDIMVGDSVYFEHPKRGHMSARVIARGKHGCTAACHLGDLYRIHWEKIIGIKEQTKQKFTMIEKGATGCIVEDDCGRRHFIETAEADYREFEKEAKAKEKEKPAKKPIKKALPTGMMLLKGRVKGHIRHTEKGKVIAVNPYETHRTQKDEKTGDLFDPDPDPEPAPPAKRPMPPAVSEDLRKAVEDGDPTRSYSQNHEDQVQVTAKALKISADAYREKLQNHVERVVASSSIWIRTPMYAINAILRDGRFKNQYETGRSSGVFKPQKRQRFEEFFFGYPERDQDKGDAVGLGRDSHLTPEQEAQRPIYGYLSDHPDGMAAMVSGKDTMAHYGGVFIKMKDDVRPYTTFCHGDSLTYMSGVESCPSPGKVGIAYPPEAQFLPSPVTQPSYRSLNFRDVVYPNQSEGKRKASLTYDPQNIGPQGTIYFEAQLHGGNYGPDDIAEVVFSKLPPEGTIDAEHVMEALDKAGIPWRTLKK